MNPGAEWEISTLYGIARATMPLNGDESFTGERADGNIPLAILLAMFRALTRMETT